MKKDKKKTTTRDFPRAMASIATIDDASHADVLSAVIQELVQDGFASRKEIIEEWYVILGVCIDSPELSCIK